MLSEEDDGEEGVEVSSRTLWLLMLGITLVTAGIAVIVIATVLLSGASSVGGVILIGPIPIVLGSGPEAGWLILVGVVLTVISVVLFLVLNRRARRV